MQFSYLQEHSTKPSLAMLASGIELESFLYNLLSNQEKERYDLIEIPKRKANWLRGRTIVKYLFLNRLQEKPSFFQIINKQSLQEFSPWMYQMVEILPKNPGKGTFPEIWFQGQSMPMNLSITHSPGLSSASIDSKSPVGIDLETIITGNNTFYQGNYTATEINWARTISQRDEINPDWLFTLLWTLKEATIKSRNTNDISVFEFPNLEIKINAENVDLQLLYLNNTLGEKFQYFEIEANARNHQVKASVSLTATSRQILSALKILK